MVPEIDKDKIFSIGAKLMRVAIERKKERGRERERESERERDGEREK